MSFVSKEEYVKYISLINEQRYDDIEPEIEEVCNDYTYVPNAKKLEHSPCGNIDLTGVNDINKIKKALYKYGSIKINDFMITINKYYGLENDVNAKIDLTIYETKFKTPSGNPCNMTYRLYLQGDKRFNTRSWIEEYSKYDPISLDTVVEIIRWINALEQLKAFM